MKQKTEVGRQQSKAGPKERINIERERRALVKTKRKESMWGSNKGAKGKNRIKARMNSLQGKSEKHNPERKV